MLDFAHVQQIENKFSFVFTQSQNSFVSFGQAKEMNKKTKREEPKTLRFLQKNTAESRKRETEQ